MAGACAFAVTALGPVSYASFSTFEVALFSMLAASYGLRSGTAAPVPIRAYVIVGLIVTAVVVLIGFAFYYSTTVAWNSIPPFCLIVIGILIAMMRRVYRNFRLTIGKDCVFLLFRR